MMPIRYGFGPFRFDQENASLSRHGAPVPLQPRAFAVLQCLLALHTGECIVTDGRLGGFAVGIAGSLARHARPGEVLASRTLRDLLAGSEVTFQDLGVLPVGPDGEEWRLFGV